MNQTPLNPDALEKVAQAISDVYDRTLPLDERHRQPMELDYKAAQAAVTAYLAVAQPEAQKLTDAEWQEFQAIPDQGYSHRAWVDARIAERVAVAQPEVNSDTELHVGTLIEDHKGRLLWHAWRTGGPGVLWLDDEGRPATPVFPARVLYRPEVKP